MFHMYSKGVMTTDGIKELHKKTLELAQIKEAKKSVKNKTPMIDKNL